MVFDETYIHYAANNTEHNRIILFCDVERPLKYRWASAFNRWFSRNVMAAAAATPPETRPAASTELFTRIYKIRERGKALKSAIARATTWRSGRWWQRCCWCSSTSESVLPAACAKVQPKA